MKSYDIVILYEHKSRELENSCLLAVELEKRGYTVGIYNIYEGFRYFVKSKVLIVPHLYNEQQLIWFAKNYAMSNRCIIDMQYEQVVTNYCENTIMLDPKGQAKNAQHIAWGKAQEEKYVRAGISESHIHNTGHIGMDLLRPEFKDYFYSKEQLAKEFDLDSSKEWILFISSFSLANRTEADIELFSILDPSTRGFAELCDKSMERILDWFEIMLKKHPEKIFIYRPHPGELHSDRITDMTKKYNNFKYIKKYSIRQWMHPIDITLNWVSTSIADVYFANKKCGLLRPLHLDEMYDLTIMKNAKFIESEEQFEDFLDTVNNEFPISESLISYNYGDKKLKPAYSLIADLAESMIKNDALGYDYNFGSSKFRCQNEKFNILTFKIYFSMLFVELAKYIDFTVLGRIFKSKKSKFELLRNEIFHYKKEVIMYKKRFYQILGTDK